MEDSDVVLMPEVELRARLGAEVARLRVLAPAFPALGVGTLRALRVRRDPELDGTEIVAGYDRYEPLAAPGKRSA